MEKATVTIPLIDLQPLEYIEVMADKFRVITLSRKYDFICKLQGVLDFIYFNDSTKALFGNLKALEEKDDGVNKTIQKVANYRMLIEVLFEIKGLF